MITPHLQINEIFCSIQGESTWSGLPCTFIRLKGCPLRCSYCDTSYAFQEGSQWSIKVTGGEPLIQDAVHPLMTQLCDLGYTVLLETSGERSLVPCDHRVKKIVDIKTPCSGAPNSFLDTNFDVLQSSDEVKFVITNREDFDWAVHIVQSHALCSKVHGVHFSPVMEQKGNASIEGCEALEPETLANWIIDCGEPVRLQLQIHKYIWSPETRGV